MGYSETVGARLRESARSDTVIDVETGTVITKVPFESTFNAVRRRLSDAEFETMVSRIRVIDESGSEIGYGGLPGSDWTGTPFEPIYSKAARDFEQSAKFFGQLVWFVSHDAAGTMGSGRYQVDGKDIGSRTYFRVNG